ncbi:MAG: dicarboxylate/amino acid:cation symporter [Vampirovibrionales bacterium]|nr:dicarboxylate/amino acid:cation symporter [Vampirovibrionales bacterium]
MNFFIKLLMAVFFGVKRHWQILIAIVLGFTLGSLFYNRHWVEDPRGLFMLQFFEFSGEVFIRLITMIVIPLVVSSLIVGVSSLKDTRQLGRMGGKVFALFVTFMLIAAAIGAGLAWVVQPGKGMHEHIASTEILTQSVSLNHQQTQLTAEDLNVAPKPISQLVLEMIPINPLEALSGNNLVPAIVYTLALGFALSFIGPAGKPLIAFFESLFTATMKLTDWVMMMAVPGVFALTFFTVATSGTDAFVRLLPFAGVIITGLLIQIVIVFPVFLQVFGRVDAIHLYRAISEAMLVAFGTASSSATLPITIANCELRAGISNRVGSFVLPTGASINKTATTMFQVVAVMFLLQAYQIAIEPWMVVMIIVLSIIASVAAAAVPSAGLITMSLILGSLGDGFTLAKFAGGMALLWSIDRVLDMCRTVVNVISSVTVAAIVAASEGELRRDVLNNPAVWQDVA